MNGKSWVVMTLTVEMILFLENFFYEINLETFQIPLIFHLSQFIVGGLATSSGVVSKCIRNFTSQELRQIMDLPPLNQVNEIKA